MYPKSMGFLLLNPLYKGMQTFCLVNCARCHFWSALYGITICILELYDSELTKITEHHIEHPNKEN